MSFVPKQDARPYVAQEGDTLAAIAARETAAGNPLTWHELARYNWGTDDPDEVDAFMRDELGCSYRGADKRFVISTEDTPHTPLLIPDRAEPHPLSPGRTYTIRVRTRKAPSQLLSCYSLPGITFGFNSSFVRPTVVEHLNALEALATLHPEAKIMIFGHTDAVGGDLYNKKLSERRAWAVYAFVTNDPDAWESLYNHPDETWGLYVIQEILTDLGHDPGPIDGDWGPQTRAAMRRFLSVPDDAPVQNDATFRRHLFAAYMAGRNDIELAPERFMEPGYMGCGEFNPVEAGTTANEDNRRVTFFFFHPDRLPTLPCAFAACGPCKQQMVTLGSRYTPSYRCSFYDSLASRCTAASLSRDIILLFHVPEEARERQQALTDWYVLRCTEPSYFEQTLYAREAEVVAENRMALVFRDTPLAGRFTLHHFYDDEASYALFEDLTHSDLMQHIGDDEPLEGSELDAEEDEDVRDEAEHEADGPDAGLPDEDEVDPDDEEAWIDTAPIPPFENDAL